jgi:hypothetical protein
MSENVVDDSSLPGDRTARTEPLPHEAADAGGGHRRSGLIALVVGALGVVFGDIGTSPLYALQTVFTIDNRAVKPTPDDVYGVVSLMFWSVTMVVSLKYVTVVMRADNEGEGGVMALVALVRRVLGGEPRQYARHRPAGGGRSVPVLRGHPDHPGDLGDVGGGGRGCCQPLPGTVRAAGVRAHPGGPVLYPAIRHAPSR